MEDQHYGKAFRPSLADAARDKLPRSERDKRVEEERNRINADLRKIGNRTDGSVIFRTVVVLSFQKGWHYRCLHWVREKRRGPYETRAKAIKAAAFELWKRPELREVRES